MLQIYDIYTYDVWGNEEDGFEVNDVFKVASNVEFLCTEDGPTDEEIRESLNIKKDYEIEVDGDPKYTLYVNGANNLYPIGELRRVYE